AKNTSPPVAMIAPAGSSRISRSTCSSRNNSSSHAMLRARNAPANSGCHETIWIDVSSTIPLSRFLAFLPHHDLIRKHPRRLPRPRVPRRQQTSPVHHHTKPPGAGAGGQLDGDQLARGIVGTEVGLQLHHAQ